MPRWRDKHGKSITSRGKIKKPSLRVRLILLILGLFALSLLVTGFVVKTTVVHQFERRMAEIAMNIAIAYRR